MNAQDHQPGHLSSKQGGSSGGKREAELEGRHSNSRLMSVYTPNFSWWVQFTRNPPSVGTIYKNATDEPFSYSTLSNLTLPLKHTAHCSLVSMDGREDKKVLWQPALPILINLSFSSFGGGCILCGLLPINKTILCWMWHYFSFSFLFFFNPSSAPFVLISLALYVC